VLPDLSRQGVAPETATADWASCSELAAVKAGRVRILTQDFAEIPGPRVADLVEAMARALHPEAS
jgi:ABC-type Fe3+-hydroxamate transport system substrate-binding protein